MNTKDLVKVGVFAALTAVGGMISVDIGEIPVTAQTIFVLLSGIVLGPKLGAMSQLVYALMGLIGLPVFAGATGGIQSVFKPSFGFIIGFTFTSYLVGSIFYGLKPSKASIILAVTLGNIMSYAIGLPYMYLIINNYLGKSIGLKYVLEVGLIPFIPGAILKMILVCGIGIKLYNMKFLKAVDN